MKKALGMHWYCCNDTVTWLNRAQSWMFWSTVSFKDFEIHLKFVCLQASQPAIRPVSTRCTVPKISDSQGNGGGFMNLLFRLTFVYCAMVIPFILHNLSLFFCILLNKASSLKKVLISSQPLFMMSHKKLHGHVTAVNNVITDTMFFMCSTLTSLNFGKFSLKTFWWNKLTNCSMQY